MSPKNANVAVGELWAYRAQTTGPFHEVRVISIGTKRPPRIRIEFVADKWEGDRRWVSPARLEVLWQDVDEYRAWTEAYEALDKASQPTEAEHNAAQTVFLKLIDEAVAELSWQGMHGVTHIRDLDRVAELTGLDVAMLTGHPTTVWAEDSIDVPWPVTEQIVTAFARRSPDSLLEYIRDEEQTIQRESVIGAEIPAWASRDGQENRTTGKRALELFDERVRQSSNR